jgi:type III pantothenate kinase
MSSASELIAVDVGNSRIKLGRFRRAEIALDPTLSQWEREKRAPGLPQPIDTFDLSLASTAGDLDVGLLSLWCRDHVGKSAKWLVASVHRAAAERLAAAVADLAAGAHADWPLQHVTYLDVPLLIDVDEPDRVGIDRLLAALAANHLRSPDRGAIVVDLGSGITVDLVDPSGAFVGGAILPGLTMSARALHEHTDALPLVCVDRLAASPTPLGKSTVAAIESGLVWGTVGAVRELISRLSADLADPPEVFVTGGGSAAIVELIGTGAATSVSHVPHLVLAGIALVNEQSRDG